jgi:hypothetical protein
MILTREMVPRIRQSNREFGKHLSHNVICENEPLDTRHFTPLVGKWTGLIELDTRPFRGQKREEPFPLPSLVAINPPLPLAGPEHIHPDCTG